MQVYNKNIFAIIKKLKNPIESVQAVKNIPEARAGSIFIDSNMYGMNEPKNPATKKFINAAVKKTKLTLMS